MTPGFSCVYLLWMWLEGRWFRLPRWDWWPQCRMFTKTVIIADRCGHDEVLFWSAGAETGPTAWTATSIFCLKESFEACEFASLRFALMPNETTLLIYTVYATFKAGYVPVSPIQRFTLTKTRQRAACNQTNCSLINWLRPPNLSLLDVVQSHRRGLF